MKKIILALGFLCFSAVINAQTQQKCAYANSTSSTNWPSTACFNIDSFIPNANTNIKYFNLTFHVFKKPSGVGIFDHLSAYYCQKIVDNINYQFQHIQAPTLPTLPVAQPLITDAKINFTIKNVVWHTDTLAFSTTLNNNTSSPLYQHYGDSLSYNIFIVSAPNFWGSWSNYYNNIPYMCYNYGTSFDSTNAGAGFYCHEMGHGLGSLAHTAPFDTCGNSTSPYTANPYTPVDFTIEDPVCSHHRYGWYPCVQDTVSNNIMGYNECLTYLSPKQMACFHANVASGYTLKMTTDYVYPCTYDTSKTITIKKNAVWNLPVTINGDLVVKANCSFTIRCNVNFAPGSRLIVEPKAKLVLDGATLSASCGSWKGIQVWGNPDGDQSYLRGLSPPMPSYQGLVQIINGSTIKNARIGIIACALDNNDVLDLSLTGGMIQATGANFIGNETDIYILPYSKVGSGCWFKGCAFKQDVLPTGFVSSSRIFMSGIHGVQFYGCSFLGASSAISNPLTGDGINSINSGYVLDDYISGGVTYHNVFNTTYAGGALGTGFNYAIYAQNATVFYPITVNNCIFGVPIKGDIYMNQMHYSTITTNTFTLKAIWASTTTPDYAIYLDNCHGYSTRGNNITGYLPNGTAHPHAGIIVNNGGTGANSVYNNTFINLNLGLWAQGQNQNPSPTPGSSGLIMNCNNFTNCTQDVGVVGPYPPLATTGVAKQQGSTTDPTKYVRNSYSSAGSGGNFNRYFTQNFTGYQIQHPSYANTSVIYEPSPQQTYSDSNYVKILVEPGTYSSTYCPASCTGCRTLPQLQQSIKKHHTAMLSLAEGSNEKQTQQAELAYEKNEAGNLANEKIRDFLNDTTLLNPIDSVIAVLKQNHNPNDKKMLAKAYIHKGTYGLAQTYADSVLVQNSANQDFYDMQQRLAALRANPSAYISALKNNPGLQTTLTQLANDRTKESCTNAQTILNMAFGTKFQEPFIMPVTTNGNRIGNKEDVEATSANDLVNIYPNPSQNNLFIEYAVAADENAQVIITNVNGSQVKTSKLNAGTQVNSIDVSTMPNGVYFVTLLNNNKLISHKKIVIMK